VDHVGGCDQAEEEQNKEEEHKRDIEGDKKCSVQVVVIVVVAVVVIHRDAPAHAGFLAQLPCRFIHALSFKEKIDPASAGDGGGQSKCFASKWVGTYLYILKNDGKPKRKT
jgi:hypothetical protein